MASSSLLLSPLSSTTSLDNRDLLGNSAFLQNPKLLFAAKARQGAIRRCRFKAPVARNSLDHIPKQFRQENLKDGSMENYKNVPQYLYGLSPTQMDMFMTEDNPVRRQSE
ncbi:endopeptidase Clp [Salvia divinorum]|uniref:Endopeptidase Clp n=1 Tax=Salvia divinorum TaxID=28513 RepID=A0ABD1GJM3_SALDI